MNLIPNLADVSFCIHLRLFQDASAIHSFPPVTVPTSPEYASADRNMPETDAVNVTRATMDIQAVDVSIVLSIKACSVCKLVHGLVYRGRILLEVARIHLDF